MKEALLIAIVGLVVWGASRYLTKEILKNQRRIEELRHVREEIAFIEQEYKKLVKQANHCIDRDNWKAYMIVKKRMHNLDLRWDREVVRKLVKETPPELRMAIR